MRHYAGGMEEWSERGGPIETAPPPAGQTAARRPAPAAAPARRWGSPAALLHTVVSWPFGWLLGLWLGMILLFGVLYWAGALVSPGGLLEGGRHVEADGNGLATAIYFSFVTATSVGFGDVVPTGAVRILAIMEAAAGLLLFGCIISKLVSRHQEDLIEEIHLIAYEDRLGRVRTNLHLTLTDLQSLSTECGSETIPLERMIPRIESAAMVFSGELQVIHDLLFRPQRVPAEQAIEAMLANVAAGLQELSSLLERLGPAPVSSSLGSSLGSIRLLAGEICGECVPREFAPRLKVWMDRVQSFAGRLPGT